MNRFFSKDFIKAILLSRPNRFVVRLKIDGIEMGASLPNPGKLGELFIPGVTLYVVPMRDEVKYPYRVIAVESFQGEVVMLDTHTNNKVAEHLIDTSRIPSLKDYSVKRREVTVGKSRFDFLLENKVGELLYCEFKSCTLFCGSLAMFPDAVTSRGKRHVEELALMAEQGIKTAVVFIVQSNQIKYFLPDYHTDPEFSETLYKNRNIIKIIPVLAGWNEQLELIAGGIEIPILWKIYEKEGRLDCGSFIILFHVAQDLVIDMDELGFKTFQKGFYCYVGFENNELQKKIERTRRKRKISKNELDYLSNNSIIDTIWSIRSSENLSCKIVSSLELLADKHVSGFDGVLNYFRDNPRLTREFQEMILDYKMRLIITKYL
ncbi:MAG: DNA/RNA nuclease SfsA [Spirochaetaceae bacterium]|jgi:sugar fermentation stimulation protein A|nr:DNA/RNA nuclease SfsA [Spirochaetaceae bacterium]